MSAVAVPALLLGLFTLAGTTVYLLACGQLPEDEIPLCCRRRVGSFAAHARGTALAAASVAAGGALLLLLELR